MIQQQSNFNQEFKFNKDGETSSAKLNVKGKPKIAKRKSSDSSLGSKESLKYFNIEKPNKRAKFKNPAKNQ